MDLSNADMLRMFEQMTRIREFDERAGLLMEQARVHGSVHLYCGEEAIAVGVCEALNDDDYITSTHRGHGHLIAKGGDVERMYAELFAKATGYNGGKGGSMHMAALDLGIIGANGIVAAGLPIGLGVAFASQYQGNDRVTVCFFGDGATNEGAFHEAMNMAAILKAPMVFVCENNGYGEWSSAASTTSVTDIVDRAASYGIAGAMVDGMDIAAVHEASIEAIARARSGAGPTLLECKTYRYYDHVGRDFGMLQRDPDEIARWRARDPIKQWRKVLIAQGVFDANTADTITARIAADMDRAIANAEQAPDPHPDALYEDVYSESTV
ncbi:MAG: thiamine pyrophosphate-dependent dehydrogenase E1 component subunit alpha [Gammaproteobacteria bacterium]|jgi:pyruvate dehydrogenase E1 component alpha subunit|nr:thiamine pyrophosphate-dependent dehydrogenase E1 component subunit alpha [Gammaproteobacteria bacterium]MBT3867616.1 thiamine pyrophosphate-dependent dehydrogenase E1 component subunit alpha [Gammaproteobacteria bacterium]MBT4378930.1 thiamine pyrophosphate-dependent dehydrogenase E1 component subunit alpha [Gammaproteobacteria bacterium]MBT4616041.1 thiamine pyrophosphate-dependent dehydrogenase E1 component subunit alpha [Gammaproteobacteria bacterium]MBT5196197.1 thiamine pyrophosphate-d